MPSENATAAASQVQEPGQSDGLILVETDTAALKAWAAQPEVQTERGMRRSEQPKPLEPVTVPAENMILIETRRQKGFCFAEPLLPSLKPYLHRIIRTAGLY